MLTDPAILQKVAEAGHTVFRTGDYNVNLVVERKSYHPSVYDDTLWCVYKVGGAWQTLSTSCSSVPHRRFLGEPLHPDGTAVSIPGQYRGAYRIGWHPHEGSERRHEAFVAVGGMPVWRDHNKDGNVDVGGARQVAYGINVHWGTQSAGCTVVPGRAAFAEIIAVCKLSRAAFGELFTLTILDP